MTGSGDIKKIGNPFSVTESADCSESVSLQVYHVYMDLSSMDIEYKVARNIINH